LHPASMPPPQHPEPPATAAPSAAPARAVIPPSVPPPRAPPRVVPFPIQAPISEPSLRERPLLRQLAMVVAASILIGLALGAVALRYKRESAHAWWTKVFDGRSR